MSAIETWKQRVAAHQAQWHKARAALGDAATDVWDSCSSSFTADPHRTDDVEVARLVREVHPTTTVLDVGGGAGRFALPLALRCQHVTVIEPSASMGEHLRHLAAQAGINNVSLVARRWEEAEVGLCVTPDTPQDARLQQAMRALLIETPAGYAIKGTQPGRLALISWRPE